MALRFKIPGHLRTYMDGKNEVAVEGRAATARSALDLLWALYPGVKDRVLNERGEVRTHINVFVGEENIRFTGGLETPVPEHGEIWIIPSVSGGRGAGSRLRFVHAPRARADGR